MNTHLVNIFRKLLPFFTAVLINTGYVFGQEQPTEEISDTVVQDTLKEKSKGFVILPLLYYTPDTRFALGAMGAYYFKLTDEAGAETNRLICGLPGASS